MSALTPTMHAALRVLAAGPLIAIRGGFVPASDQLAQTFGRRRPPIDRQTIDALRRRAAVKLARHSNIKRRPLIASLTARGRARAVALQQQP